MTSADANNKIQDCLTPLLSGHLPKVGFKNHWLSQAGGRRGSTRGDQRIFFENMMAGIGCSCEWPIQQWFKGQCHKIFDHFINLIDSTWAPYEQAKTVSRSFSYLQRYFIGKWENHVSAQSTTTRTHKLFFRYGHYHIFKLLLLTL